MPTQAPTFQTRVNRPRRRIVASFVVATLAFPLPACVALLDVPPGKLYEIGPDGRQRDACTAHHGAVVGDILLGSLALLGGWAGFAMGEHVDGFAAVGVIGLGGALGHFISAASSDATRCRALRGATH